MISTENKEKSIILSTLYVNMYRNCKKRELFLCSSIQKQFVRKGSSQPVEEHFEIQNLILSQSLAFLEQVNKEI